MLKADYSYFADGRLSAKDDLLDDQWDRTSKYDFAGRLSFNQFGMNTAQTKRIYEQTVGYNAFSDMVRTTEYWGTTGGFSASYTNGRKTGPTNVPTYDAAGNVVFEYQHGHSQQTTTFDAAGRRIAVRDRWQMGASASQENETAYTYDGEGRPVIEGIGVRNSPYTSAMVVNPLRYQVWSTVLGSSLTTVDTSGGKVETKVFAGRAHIATQNAEGSGEGIFYKTADPVTGTTGSFSGTASYAVKVQESEPMGQTIELTDPGTSYPSSYEEVLGMGKDAEWQCTLAAEKRSQFLDMPVHCQKKASTDPKFSLAYEFEGRYHEQNPTKVAEPTDAPIPKLSPPAGDPSSTVAAYALTATAKAPKTDEVGGYCDPSKQSCDVYAIDEKTDALSAEYASMEGWGDLIKSLAEDFVRLRRGLKNFPDEEYSKQGYSKNSDADSCRDKVLRPLESIGFDLNAFVSYLNRGAEFFDGTSGAKSATSFNAIYGQNPITSGTPPANAYTIGQYFRDNPLDEALTSISYSSNKLTVGFRPTITSSVGLIFHEALHGYGASLNSGKSAGAFSDAGLKLLFGLKGSGTASIGEHISQYCGGYFWNLN